METTQLHEATHKIKMLVYARKNSQDSQHESGKSYHGKQTGTNVVLFPRSVSSLDLSGDSDKYLHIKNYLSPNCHSTLRKTNSIKDHFRAQSQASPQLRIRGFWALYWCGWDQIWAFEFWCSGEEEARVHHLLPYPASNHAQVFVTIKSTCKLYSKTYFYECMTKIESSQIKVSREEEITGKRWGST